MSSGFSAPSPAWPLRLSYGLWTFGALLFAGAAIVASSRSLYASIAEDAISSGELLATLAALAFAFLAIWSAWWCRIGAFPFRFVADPIKSECGYRWGFWWAQREDLSDVDQLRGQVMFVTTRPGPGSWRWKIYALRGEGRDVVHLFGPLRTYNSEDQAEADCEAFIRNFADCLDLPFEVITPPKIGQGEQA